MKKTYQAYDNYKDVILDFLQLSSQNRIIYVPKS